MCHRFVSESVMHKEVIYVVFSFFYFAIYAGPQFVEIQKFLLSWQHDVTSLFSKIERQIGDEDPN